NVTVIGILLHSTGRDPRHCELARVNAYSWFTEFQHFHRPDSSYPGDASCGLPPHEPGVSAFDHTYFVHLGDALEEKEFDQAARSVAEYLRLDVLSPAQLPLDAGRKQQPATIQSASEEEATTNLRSFGVSSGNNPETAVCDAAVSLVSVELL